MFGYDLVRDVVIFFVRKNYLDCFSRLAIMLWRKCSHACFVWNIPFFVHVLCLAPLTRNCETVLFF